MFEEHMRHREQDSMFRPLHQDHAIESVIFRLTGSGEMTEHERGNLDEGYQKYWKPVLPKANQAQVMEIAMGPTPLVDGRPKPLAPTQYVEFMRSGKAAWWMDIAGATITVGCAQYGGWKSVSRKTYELFGSVGKALGNTHPLAQIRSVELTYQDLLLWDGSDDTYDPELAIRKSRIPTKARRSKEWHTGEGWVVEAAGGRVLERFQVGAELREQQKPVVQVVTTAIWGFGETSARLNLNRAFGSIHSVGDNSDGRAICESLHARTHALFGSLITEDVAIRIGLRQQGEST